MDEGGGLAAPWSVREQLTPDPGGGGACGDVEMHQFAPVGPDDEEDVDDPVVNGLDNQEISRPDAFHVIRKEGSPGLAAGRSWLPPTVATNRPVAHSDSKLQQLTPDTLGPPGRIL